MIFKSFRLFCVTTLCFCALNIPVCFATSAPSSDKVDLGALGPSSQKKQIKKVVEHTFSQMTYDNLYKLAWSYDAFSPDNTEALNTYLMITECNLYNKFFSNEFEWEKIKIATKDFLKKNKGNVSRYYEYVQPIYMGRYDYSLQGFPIVNSENFKGQKNLQFASYPSGLTSCGGYDISSMTYPSTGVLSLSSPLNLSFVRVPLSLAQKYVEWRTKQGMFDDERRQAYIRYRIRIDGYEGIKGFAGLKAFGFNGKLLRLDVFADQDMLLPLYNQVF
jgi:hypothetical protein